jgi:hypothetical protein
MEIKKRETKKTSVFNIFQSIFYSFFYGGISFSSIEEEKI